MQRSRLPRPASILIIGSCLIAAAVFSWAPLLPPPRDPISAAIFGVLSFVVAPRRVRIHPRAVSISLGFVLVMVALFRCGTLVAMAVAAANMLACHLLPSKEGPPPRLYVTAYNTATLTAAAFACGLVQTEVMRLAVGARLPWPDILAALAAVVAYNAVSVVAVGLVTMLSQPCSPPRRWWSDLLSTVPIYIAGGAMAFALNEAIDLNGRWVLILGLPFAYIIHKTYKTQAEKLDAEVERREASDKMANLYLSVVETLSNAIDMKDHRTHTHVRRVHQLAQAVGERMGLQGAQIEAVRIGAVLHDIGKLAVPDHILRKPGRLTDAEFSMVKEHPRAGEAILQPIDFGVPVAEIVRHHHEKLDGSGYPDGLRGDEISIGARVLAVIDVYDALVADRPYRKAWTTEQALAYLRYEANRSFDAQVVEALAAVIAAGEGESCPDGAAEPMTGEAVPYTGAQGLAPLDEVLIARVAEEARRNVLRGLAEFVAGRGSFLATVIYEVIGTSGEIDAVAALGPCASCFQLARIPLGLGTSSQAAHFRCPATGAAAGEFEAFPEGVPPELSRAQVTAVPLVGADGATLAVISVYYMDRALGPAIERDEEIRSVAAVAARQMELIGEGLLPPARREAPAPAPLLQSVPAGGS